MGKDIHSTNRIKLKGLSSYIIRKMDVEDLDEVVSISNSSPCNSWSKQLFLEEMSSHTSQCFIIKWENTLVGFICFRNFDGESELLNMGIHPKYQRLGFGKELMRFYIDHCKSMKINKSFLEVCTSNQSAIQLYKLFSFRTVGIRKKFYQGIWDAYVMEKEI